MNSLPENFFPYERLLVALARAGIDFAVVGGVAISMNGYVRATEDVDIIVDPAPENLHKLLECLKQWGEGWARELKMEDFQIEAGAIRLVEDLIFLKEGSWRDKDKLDVLAMREIIAWEGR
ncbi:MAG TPA: hypothetical protein VFV23_14455 [Verrucomicrobiae bacterium]|nr:hypothetical protein [Verrucomicrobiae bacterium]